MAEAPLWRRLTAEFIGSAFLAAVVIGSGIAARQLSPGIPVLERLRECGRHRGRALRLDSDGWPGVRGALQPGGRPL